MVVVNVLKMVKVAMIAIVAEIVCFHQKFILSLAIFLRYVAANPVCPGFGIRFPPTAKI